MSSNRVCPQTDSLWHGCIEEKWVFIVALTILWGWRICCCGLADVCKHECFSNCFKVLSKYIDCGENKVSCVNEFKGEAKEELRWPWSWTSIVSVLRNPAELSESRGQDGLLLPQCGIFQWQRPINLFYSPRKVNRFESIRSRYWVSWEANDTSNFTEFSEPEITKTGVIISLYYVFKGLGCLGVVSGSLLTLKASLQACVRYAKVIRGRAVQKNFLLTAFFTCPGWTEMSEEGWPPL